MFRNRTMKSNHLSDTGIDSPGVLTETIGNPPVRSVLDVTCRPALPDRHFASQFLMFVGSQTTVAPGVPQNDKIALYAATRRDLNRSDDIWAANFLCDVFTGANKYNVIGLEIDINNHDADVSFPQNKLMDGLAINSGLSKKAGTAIHVGRIQPGAEWQRGIQLKRNGIHSLALQVGDLEIPATATFDQWNNGGDTVVLRRKTDTNHSGHFLRCVDMVNGQNLFAIDTKGDMYFKGASAIAVTVIADFYKQGNPIGVFQKLAELEQRIKTLENKSLRE
jgi:hypothetical protein